MPRLGNGLPVLAHHLNVSAERVAEPREGLVGALADSSNVYTEIRRRRGVGSVFWIVFDDDCVRADSYLIPRCFRSFAQNGAREFVAVGAVESDRTRPLPEHGRNHSRAGEADI
jgi:hypothetical protein